MGNLASFFYYETLGMSQTFLQSKRQAGDGCDLFMYDYLMGANGNVFRVV